MMTVLSTLAVAALWLTGFAVAFRAAATAKTPQGAVAWVVFLVTSPFLALPLWLVLGSHRHRGYEIARRDSERVADGIKRYAAAHAPIARDTDGICDAFEAITKMPVVRGNDAELLIDGTATFEAIFAAIDAAQNYVLVQFYTIVADDLGHALKDRLIAATGRGVSVRLLYDEIGSHGLPADYLNALRAAGVTVMDPSRSPGSGSRLRINFRNHRKIVVVDGAIGFLGGLNVSDLYLGHGRFDPWRDTHLRLAGPVVSQLQLVFAEDWHWSMRETLFDALDWTAPEAQADRSALIVATGPGDDLETGSLYFFSLITAARRRIWIASPYFVPDADIVTALIHAALRGVEVRILVPDQADHRTPWLAAFAYFDEIMNAGVEVWRFQEGFMHQKVVLVDDGIAAVGTTNLDTRSCRLNFEAMAVLFDQEFAGRVDQMLSADFTRARRLDRPLSEQPLARRLGAPVARLFAPLL